MKTLSSEATVIIPSSERRPTHYYETSYKVTLKNSYYYRFFQI